jgi:hypothetical protein
VSDLDHQRNLQNFSKLSYVPICIQGVTGNHDALNDSGSQVNLIKRYLLQQLPEIQTTGCVGIKGIVGPAIETDLVLLDIKPAPTEVGCTNIAPPLREIFAVCDELNEDIILTADTVKRLSSSSSSTLFQAQRPIAKQGNAETIKQNKNKQTDKLEIRSTLNDLQHPQ